MQLIDRGAWILTQSELTVPVLLIQGTADHLVDPLATRRFANNIHANLTYKEWKGGYHELHNEPEKLEVFALMLAWLNQQVATQAA
jgi:acylglycerol lipase